MSVADLVQLLVETTLAGSAAVLLVLLLRRRLRAAFGASVAYATWALVLVALVAVLLPAATRSGTAMPMAQVMVAMPMQALAPNAASVDYRPWLCAIWLLGVAVAMWRFARQQRAFRRGLGRLQHRADGLQQAEAIEGLPAAIGLWKPAIVVPADFDVRYSAEQRALMQAHERTHIARGDLHANALMALLRSLFWFNPLLHLAARHFRHDQELACDLRVIARHPHARRAYGEAMFKTQLAMQPLPLGCHWGTHPLKERIEMLKQPVPSLSRWLGGSVVVVALTLAAGVTAWAAQPSRPAARATMPTPPAAPVPPAEPTIPAPPVPPAPPPPPAIPPVPPVAPAPPLSSQASDPMPPPPYPEQALKQGLDGMVMLLIAVGADGKPTAVQVEHSEPAGVFDAAAVNAAKQWTFMPERKHGKPVAGRVRVPITFKAPKTPAPSQG